MTIPYKNRLVLTGESFIPTDVFERLKGTLRDGKGEPYKNARNLAAGSARSYDPANCAGRSVHFMTFNVLEGMDELPFPDSRHAKIQHLQEFGFDICPYSFISNPVMDVETMTLAIETLKGYAEEKYLPIDGIVIIYDSLSYSKACGRTGHHYKDGLAFKFEDGLPRRRLRCRP